MILLGGGMLVRLQAAKETGEVTMPLTHDFKETIWARAQKDPAFRAALLREGIEAFLAGDVDARKAVIRDYINATIGFQALAKATKTPPKSLMRQFGRATRKRGTYLRCSVICRSKLDFALNCTRRSAETVFHGGFRPTK